MAGNEIRKIMVRVRTKGLKQLSASFKGVDKDVSRINAELVRTDKLAKSVSNSLSNISIGSAPLKALAGLNTKLDEMYNHMKTAGAATGALVSDMSELKRTVSTIGAVIGNTYEELGQLSNVSNKTQRALKGVNNQLKQTGRSGKGAVSTFKSLSRLGGPVVVAFASISASIFTVREALRILGDSAALTRLEGAMVTLGKGDNLVRLASDLREVAVGALSVDESLRLAAASSARGFDSKQMKEMTLVALKASIALGIDFADALNRVTKAIAKQEVEMLDELGITTRLSTAMANYADNLGRTASSLTDAERQQALYIEVMRQANNGYGTLNVTATEYEKLLASSSSLARSLGKGIVTVLNPAMKGLNAVLGDVVKSLNEEQAGEAAIKGAAKAMKGSIIEKVKAYAALNVEMENYKKNRSTKAANYWTGESTRSKNVEKTAAAMRTLKKEMGGVESVINFDKATKGLNEFTKAMLKVANKTKLELPFAEEVAKVSGALNNLNASFDEVGSGADKLRAKYEKVIGTTLELRLAALKLSSKAEDEYKGRIESINAYNWRMQASVAISKELYVLETRINARKGAGKATKDLDVLKRTLELSKMSLERQERKTVLETKLAADAAYANVGITNQNTLYDYQLSIIQSKLDAQAQGAIYTKAEITALNEQTRLIEKQKTLQTQKDSNNLGSLFGNKTLNSQNDVRNTPDSEANDLAIFDQASEGVNSALTSLMAMDSVLGSIQGGFIGLGQIIAQSMSNGEVSMQGVAMGLGAIGGIMSGVSASAVSDIDQQIAMERKRDGQSSKSVAKLAALNKKKLKEQQKAKLQSAVMSTAAGIASALELPFPMNLIAAGITGAMGLQQISAIKSQGKNASALSAVGSGGTQSIDFGSRSNKVDVSQVGTAGERAYVTGQAGTGTNANDFVGAAHGASFVVGERGPEIFTPEMSGSIVPSGDTVSTSTKNITFALNISAMDAASIVDRGSDIVEAVEAEIQARYGKSLADM